MAVPAKLGELHLRNTTELWTDDANLGMGGGCRIIPVEIGLSPWTGGVGRVQNRSPERKPWGEMPFEP